MSINGKKTFWTLVIVYLRCVNHLTQLVYVSLVEYLAISKRMRKYELSSNAFVWPERGILRRITGLNICPNLDATNNRNLKWNQFAEISSKWQKLKTLTFLVIRYSQLLRMSFCSFRGIKMNSCITRFSNCSCENVTFSQSQFFRFNLKASNFQRKIPKVLALRKHKE